MLTRLRVCCAVLLAAVLGAAPAAAQAICVPSGGGGAVPASGTGGTGAVWPGTLPAAPFTNSYAVTVPAGSTQIAKVDFTFSTEHTWVGDLHMVLTDPSGGVHNLLHRVGSTGTGVGLNCDLNGAYSIYDSGAQAWPTTCPASTDVPSGDYNQSFGGWPSGTNGIFNTPLSAIPVSSGNWTLTIYDWAGGDSGVLASWQLCFDVSSASIQPGSDLWNTPGLGCTYQEFPVNSLPANFFGAGGNPWPSGASMFIGFVGTPLTGTGMVGNVDTIVERLAPANIGACGTQDTVPIQIKALSLESFKPVLVNFSGSISKYDVVACLENVAQPIGSMTIRREHAGGGTFDSTLPVIVRLTFNKISGANGVASATINNALLTFQNPGSSGISACWSYNDGGLGIPSSPGGSGFDCGGNAFSFPATSNFYAGVCYPGADCNNPGGAPEPQLTVENALLARHCVLPVALPPSTTGYCYCSTSQPPGAPCGNFDPNAGCANSFGQGMRLDVTGNASVQTDTVLISVTGGPTTGTALLIWGNGATFGLFGDGQLCVSQVRRAGTRQLVGGAATWAGLAVASQVPPTGGIRTYQVWYRNSATFCTPDTFNMSNAYQVMWLP